MDEKVTIDVSSILEHLEQEVRQGIRSGQYTLTDVSILLGSAFCEFKDKVTSDIGKIIEEEEASQSPDICKDCGNALKKTTN